MKVQFAEKNITVGKINDICSGEMYLCGVSEDSIVTGICTDSRESDECTLFAAIKGERTDGHDYILTCLKNGCPFALAERLPDITGYSKYAFVIVPSVLSAIEKLAKNLKERANCYTVGVTGSVGKTTTKEFISAVLNERFRTFKTEGNHNSVIGMPLSVMGMPAETDAAVLEMGMSGFGEIASMSRAARPDAAVITTIGTSHMEMLGSRENICLAKMEIAEGLADDGVLILNGDEPLLLNADKKGHRVLYVGTENRDADIRALNIRMEIGKTTFDLLSEGKIYSNIELPVMGAHNVYAALFAFAVGKELNMDTESIRRGLMNFKNAQMRQNIYELCGITVIEDCYNASPESMRSAIDVMNELSLRREKARMVALLGDMLELGDNSPELHRNVGEYLAKSGCSVLFTYGERAKDIALAAIEHGMKPENVYVNPKANTPEAMGDMMLHAIRENDILLVKASRSMAAEKVIAYLKENMESKMSK
ncbi:MAG: UDP-N-acetylmuramoyl-tripeptide--D-alanyl-D-alanine ligase [Clostridia bacterium]|nr:UDP-N-acetylmuramoyl-tripeptide--D-alanyl-D-alanine ligase [Clostridia bacterium]